MEILIICLIVIVILLIAALIHRSIKNHPKVTEIEMHGTENNEMIISHHSLSQQQIQFEMLPVTQDFDGKRLVAIKDKKVINHFTNLVPESVKLLTNAGSAKQYKEVVKAGGELYQAIIPKGAVLDKSSSMVGAVRGSYRTTGKIKGNANWLSANSTTSKMARVNATNAVMGVGAMVVGQYYMEQINAELKDISDGINKVADFQDHEFRSKIFALVTLVQNMSRFQIDILENDELRGRELSNLDNSEKECVQLLGQANLTIDGFARKQNLKFEKYEEELIETQKWIVYQNTLLDILYKIADLKHALNFGTVSREKCYALISIYSDQVKNTQERLKEWHISHVDNIGIDIEKNRRKRAKLDMFIHKLPGLINEDYNFMGISEKTVDMISSQLIIHDNLSINEKTDLFHEDVKVIIKEGELYYLPEDSLTN